MTPIQKLIIYYFSGTGNSKNVALWFAKKATIQGILCHIISIADIDRKHIETPPSDALILFVSPVHGFNYPPVMMHFIMRFPRGRNKAVLMNTRAGMLIGNWNLPGLSGISLYFAALCLKIKGHSIQGTMPVDLPSNWISLHPGLNDRTIKLLHEKNRTRVDDFADIIISGKKSYKASPEIIQDIAVAPVSLGYYFIGRFLFSKSYYASSDCNNCDICMKNCPVKAIIKVDNRPFWTYNCESCMKCMSYCPKKAIETAHGSIAEYWILYSMVLIVVFHKYFDTWFFPIENWLIRWLIETSFFLIFLGIWYRIMHFMLRYRWFERFVVYTSLTKYKWWGRRYKALEEN
jgi:ferredoxin